MTVLLAGMYNNLLLYQVVRRGLLGSYCKMLAFFTTKISPETVQRCISSSFIHRLTQN